MYSVFEKFSHKWSGILRNQKLEMGIMDGYFLLYISGLFKTLPNTQDLRSIL